jgi:hypothetical protein
MKKYYLMENRVKLNLLSKGNKQSRGMSMVTTMQQRTSSNHHTLNNNEIDKKCKKHDGESNEKETNGSSSAALVAAASASRTNHLQPEAINSRKRRYESFINDIQQQNAAKSVESFLITPLQLNDKENHENNQTSGSVIENRNFFEIWRNRGLKKKRSSVGEDLVQPEEKKILDTSNITNILH